MVNIPAILVANISALVLLCIVLFSSQKAVRTASFDNTLFTVMLVFCMLQCVVETAGFLVDGKGGALCFTLNRIFNFLLFFNNIGFAFTWTMYADYKLFGDIRRIRRIYPFVAIPMLLVWLGDIINFFTPVFFRITAANVYERTGLYLVPFAFTYLYLAYGVLLIYFYRNRVNKYLFLPAIVFMLPILIGSIVQFFFYGLSLIWLGCAIALSSLYINVQNEVSFIDPLTGLFTRQYLIQYLNIKLKNPDQDNGAVGLMLDIDRFKEINDTYGHLVGDEAIAAAGHLLMTSVGPKDMAARYAGDEFVIILLQGGEQAAKDLVQHINKAAEQLKKEKNTPYTIHFSVGCGSYNRQDTIDTFLARIDAAMYEDKRCRQEDAPHRAGR